MNVLPPLRSLISVRRVVLDKVGSVLERYDYYPYGEIIPATVATSGNTDYLYTGKESQNALFGINWYDSAARFQTTDGIFTSLDPLAEKYYHLSPYAYCAGNPVNVLDPDGEAAHVFVGALVGAMIEGGIAIYHGKSAREVAGAAVRGAIEGGVIAATLGVGTEAILGSVLLKEAAKGFVAGAMSSAAGSMAEQYISGDPIDTKEVAKAAGIGAATGLVGAALNFGTNAASATVEKTIEKKYASSTVKDTYRNEIKHELRSEGKQVKGSTLNKKVEERVKTNCEAEKSFVGFLRGVGSYSVQKTSNSVVEEVITY